MRASSIFTVILLGAAVTVASAEAETDLAIDSLRVQRSVSLTEKQKIRQVRASLRLRNRGSDSVVFPDQATLLDAVRIEAIPEAGAIHCGPVLRSFLPRKSQIFPIALDPGQRIRLRFRLEISCGSNPAKQALDWNFVASVDSALVDGSIDINPLDNLCPRDRSTLDRGCGKPIGAGQRIAPSLDVVDRRAALRFQQTGPFAVGITNRVFVDANRPTMPNGEFAGAPERRLPTRVWYPAAAGQSGLNAPVRGSGAPYPFIIFSHGLGSPNNASQFLMIHLASHGYIVAAPAYPLSKIGAPGGQTIADTPAEAGDVSFLIDMFIALNETDGDRFEGGIDATRIALTGHSAGGLTTIVSSYDSLLRDTRIKASAPMSPAACFFQPGYFDDLTVPMLLLHGDHDLLVDVDAHGQSVFDRANAPKSFVRIIGGNHLGFSDAGTVIGDDVGCLFLPDPNTLGDQGPSLIAALGGTENFVSEEGCPTEICVGDPMAIDGFRQQQITKAAILAFFEWRLRGDLGADQYLLNDLDPQNQDLSYSQF